MAISGYVLANPYISFPDITLPTSSSILLNQDMQIQEMSSFNQNEIPKAC